MKYLIFLISFFLLSCGISTDQKKRRDNEEQAKSAEIEKIKSQYKYWCEDFYFQTKEHRLKYYCPISEANEDSLPSDVSYNKDSERKMFKAYEIKDFGNACILMTEYIQKVQINKKILLDYAVKNGFYDRNLYVEKNSPDYAYVQNVEKLASDACQQSVKQFDKKLKESQERENLRLNVICPIYYLARQSCAAAGNYENCMDIRMSGNFSRNDDQICFKR